VIGTGCDVDGADCDILTVRFLDGRLGEAYNIPTVSVASSSRL
jgi:hypothetical protein